jgi:hypothetical protein
MHNLNKAQRALEENEKQLSEEATKPIAEKDKLEKKILELQRKLDEKNWDAEKAKLKAGKAEAQEVEDAIIQENARSAEVGQSAQDLTPPSTNSFPRSSLESGLSQTSDSPKPLLCKGKECLDSTGRDENM